MRGEVQIVRSRILLTLLTLKTWGQAAETQTPYYCADWFFAYMQINWCSISATNKDYLSERKTLLLLIKGSGGGALEN